MKQSRLASLLLLVAFLAVPVLTAQSTPFTVVNAASYSGVIAPDSLASIFGATLAPTIASATLDSNGQLPTELAATRVEINGVASPLFFVSPSQINLVVPGGLAEGTATVLIRSTLTGVTRSGTALVRAAAPALFTSDASGSGPGALLNAVTYQPPPFLVQTPENGADTRTRIAVYGTGLRHAGKVTGLAQNPAGDRFALPVEYAGPAPGYFGLDQVNLVLTSDLDGAGTVSLSIKGDDTTANVVTFAMNLMPAIFLQLSTLTLSPAVVTAGESSVLTVGLNGVARSAGFAVGLHSNNAAVPVISQITIPEGKVSAETTLTTSSATTTSAAIITAQARDVTQSVTLDIEPANTLQLVSLTTTPVSVQGGRSLTGTVNLNGGAPAGGVKILLDSDNDAVRPQLVVSVPFNASSLDFPIATSVVTSPQTVTLNASLSHSTATAKLTVLPAMQLSLSAGAVVGGNPVDGTVTLAELAPPVFGATVTLQSGDPTVKVPPAPVTVSPGRSLQTFTLTTSPVISSRTVSITASYAGTSQTAMLTVNPPPPATLASLAISPDHVAGGTSTQATATLTAPAGAGGIRVDLVSSDVRTATVSPNFVLIPQGQSSALFTIATSRFAGVVTLTATAGGVSKTASLTVQ